MTTKRPKYRLKSVDFSKESESCLIFFEVTLQDGWYFGLLVAIYQKPKDENMRWTGHCILILLEIFRKFAVENCSHSLDYPVSLQNLCNSPPLTLCTRCAIIANLPQFVSFARDRVSVYASKNPVANIARIWNNIIFSIVEKVSYEYSMQKYFQEREL